MGFKIADGYVAVKPDDTGFEDDLRAKIAAAAEGVKAEVSLRLNADAPISLNEDVHAAIDLATEGVKAQVGLGLKGDAVEALDADVKAGIDLVEADAKVKVSVDPKQAADAGSEGGGLLMAAIAAGAGLGAPALLAVTGAAFVGVAALALDSNKTIAADYSQLGKDASAALKQATAPLAGTMNQDVQTLDSSLKGLQPTLDTLFAGVGPDITSVTGGLVNFADNALPGLSQAVNNSHADVQGLANGLGELGTGVGGFFTGLTRDSTTTAAGLQSTLGLVGNALTTVGDVAGSASSAISVDLMAIIPAADAVLSAIDKLADPATIGAAAGAFAAFKLGSPIQSGLLSTAEKFSGVADKAEDATGILGKVGSASGKMAGAFSSAAEVMGGPWGIALGAGIGLVSGLVGSLMSASHATDAVTLSQQGLTQAVQADNGQIGQNTAAFVAQQAQASGLADIAAKANVSISALTQAISGNEKAQQAVTASINKTNDAARYQEAATINTLGATGQFTTGLNVANQSVAQAAATSNVLTDANRKLENSIKAQTGEIAAAITKQQQLQAATNSLNNVTNIFTATLKSDYTQLVATAQQQAENSVAALNLGTANTSLSMSLYKTVTAYNTATAQASGYNAILQALDGTTMGVDQAQNALAQQMLTAKTSFKANKESLDENTQAGISDRQSLVSAAQAITALGVAQYQASGSIGKGNETIKQQIAKFVSATGATGKAKTAIESYLESIAKIPANTTTTVHANTQDALNALDRVLSAEQSVGTAATVNASELAHQLDHKAGGGNVRAGQAYVVGDGGQPEVFVAPTDGYIYPSVGQGQQAVAQHNAQVASTSSAAAPGMAPHAPAQINFYGTQYPNTEQMAALHREFATAGAY